ncbi:hypothetical protein CC78DRAFT_586118 [Lojkania enalia]|uniref:Uncharacterized protein n=1 Tax=Lojkania enalia TaxID=147567 RepID=A0A9P4N5D1_9PLEO|nr:hypothetical protein CC78DRAFT_586118 [Didymosphaeria enalia]
MYGFTAGHVIKQMQKRTESSGSPSATKLLLSVAPDIEGFICEDNILGSILDPELLPGVAAGNTAPSHDWVLFSLELPRPNQVPKIHSTEQFTDGVSNSVLLLGGTHGIRRGELSDSMARVLIRQGEGFVDAYMLELEEGQVRDGDSGAWVVRNAAPELYGHVVATDALGDAYVIPVPNTFDNIRDCMGAASVQLPRSSDFAHFHTNTSPTVAERPQTMPEKKRLRRIYDDPRNNPTLPDPWGIFLQVSDANYQGEEIREFCDNVAMLDSTSHIGSPQRKAWLDDREYQTSRSRGYPGSLLASQLQQYLRTARFCSKGLPDADRRHETIWKHITSQASFNITNNVDYYYTFRLECHIPFMYMVSLLPGKFSSGVTFRKNDWSDATLSRGSPSEMWSKSIQYAREAQFSLLINGSKDHEWVAYALADCRYDGYEEEENCDDCEDDESEDFDCICEDPIIGDSTFVIDSNKPIWDPRSYFFLTLRNRMAHVSDEWHKITRVIELSIKQHTLDHPLASSKLGHVMPQQFGVIEKANKRTSRFLVPVSHINDMLLRTNDAWQNFRTQESNARYECQSFEDMRKINESFNNIWSLKRRFDLMEKKLHIQLDFEARQLHQRTLALMLNRNMLLYNATNMLSDSNRMICLDGKVNESYHITFFNVVVPIATVSSYFGTTSGTVPFTRNVTSFIISLAVLILALRITMMLLDNLKAVVMTETVEMRGVYKFS